MNGFLVLLCHALDDLPLFLTDDRTQAMRFAEAVDWFPPTDVIQNVFHLDACTTPMVVKVVEFKEGQPVEVTIVRSYDEGDSDGEEG